MAAMYPCPPWAGQPIRVPFAPPPHRIRHALWVVPLRAFRCVLSPAHPPFSFTVYFAFTDTGWLEVSDAFPSRPAV